jgi:hypothetical protein
MAISSGSSISSLGVLRQISQEIDTLSLRERKTAKVYLKASINQPGDVEPKWSDMHVKVLTRRELKEGSADLKKVAVAFASLLATSSKEISQMSGEQKAQALQQFWKCYDYYSERLEKPVENAMRNAKESLPVIHLPENEIGTTLRVMEKSILERKEDHLDAGKHFFANVFMFAVVGAASFAMGGACLAVAVIFGALPLLAIAVPAFVAIPFMMKFSIDSARSATRHQQEVRKLDQVLKTIDEAKNGLQPSKTKEAFTTMWASLSQTERSTAIIQLDEETLKAVEEKFDENDKKTLKLRDDWKKFVSGDQSCLGAATEFFVRFGPFSLNEFNLDQLSALYENSIRANPKASFKQTSMLESKFTELLRKETDSASLTHRLLHTDKDSALSKILVERLQELAK